MYHGWVFELFDARIWDKQLQILAASFAAPHSKSVHQKESGTEPALQKVETPHQPMQIGIGNRLKQKRYSPPACVSFGLLSILTRPNIDLDRSLIGIKFQLKSNDGKEVQSYVWRIDEMESVSRVVQLAS